MKEDEEEDEGREAPPPLLVELRTRVWAQESDTGPVWFHSESINERQRDLSSGA